MQDERPVNFFARTWAAFTQAFTTKTAISPPSTSSSKGDFSIPNYLSTLPNLSDFSTMLLYELQLHLATLTPPRSSASTQKRVETDSSSLKYEDMECGCCFSDMNVAQAVTCAEGCLFCKDCLARAVQESVYGQAPLRLYRFDSEDKNDFTGGEGTGIRCLSIEGCQASFSDKELRRSLPKELHAALETRLAQQNLQVLQACMNKSNGKRVRTVQCPFCPYIEVEDIPTLRKLWENTSTVTNMLIGLLSSIAVGLLYLAWMLGAIFLPDLLNTHTPWNVNMGDQSTRSMGEQQGPLYFAIQPIEGLKEISKRIQQVFDVSVTKHGGTVFRCKNVSKDQHKPASSSIASPAYIYSLLPPSPPSSQSTQPTPTLTNSCGRPSCRLCHKLHYPGHECQDSLSGLRLAKETAASNAIKRQCPECGLSFVKDNGCNKIVCRCGYTMCFLCRKGIGNERYEHFCQHPREREYSFLPESACAKLMMLYLSLSP